MAKPYCTGEGCPIAFTCDLFKRDVDKARELHFAWVPYNHEKKECEFYLGTKPTDVWRQANDELRKNLD